MSGDIGRRSSSEVAHEAEDTRANLASTLEQLRNNLRPENVMDEVVFNARIGASTMADSVMGVAKQYPIPSMLIAAGSAMILGLFAKRSGKSSVTGFEGLDTEARFRAAEGRSAADFVSNEGSDAAQSDELRAGEGVLRPPRSVKVSRARGDALTGHVTNQADALKQTASHAYDSTSSQAGDAMQNLSRYIPHDRGEVKSKLSTLLDEQPLILGAIGLAIGAAIGAALPMTETEDSLMGGTAHRLRDTATDAARHEIDGLRVAAGEAVSNVRQSAGDNLHDFVKDVTDNAKTVVGKAGDTIAPGSRDV